MAFYDNLLKLCAQNNVTPSGVAREVGLSNAAANGWKNGKNPSDVTLRKLSAFFNVTVEELTSDKEKKPAPTNGNGLEDEFLQLFRRLSPEEQERELAYLRELAERRERA